MRVADYLLPVVLSLRMGCQSLSDPIRYCESTASGLMHGCGFLRDGYYRELATAATSRQFGHALVRTTAEMDTIVIFYGWTPYELSQFTLRFLTRRSRIAGFRQMLTLTLALVLRRWC